MIVHQELNGKENCLNRDGSIQDRSRILFLNRSYWPDAEATGQLLTELCEDLTGRFDVSVLAGQPNQNPNGETYNRSRHQERNGVLIERVRHPQWSKRSLIGRAINLIGFLFAATFRSLRISRPDFVIVETDPFMLPMLGRWLKWWHGSRLIVYLQDLYPDVAVVLEKVREGWLTRLIRWQLTAAYRQADAIVVLSGDMKNTLINWGIESSRIVCIENWVDTSSVFPVKTKNAFRERFGLHSKFIVMHSGNMGLSQYLDNVLKAADLLGDRTDIEVFLVGDGATRRGLEETAIQFDLNNVRFLPYQPREELAQSLSAADIHLISMHPEVHRCLMPSKLYGILASGSPVLAIAAEESELARSIDEFQIGFTVPPGDPVALAERLRWCADHRIELVEMGERARSVAVEHYDRKRQTSRFADLILNISNGVVEPNSPRSNQKNKPVGRI